MARFEDEETDGRTDGRTTLEIRRAAATVYTGYESRKSRTLGVILIIGGALTAAFNSVTLVVQEEGARYVYQYEPPHTDTWGRYWWVVSRAHYVSAGLWAALLFVLCGAFGICAGRWRTKRAILTHHVMGHVASVCAAILVCVSVWAIIEDWRRVAAGFIYKRYWTDGSMPFKQYSDYEIDDSAERLAMVSLVFSCSLLAVGIVVLVSAIWSTTLGVRILCRAHTQDLEPYMVYMPNPEGEVPRVMMVDVRDKAARGGSVVTIPSEPPPRQPYHIRSASHQLGSAPHPLGSAPGPYSGMETDKQKPDAKGSAPNPPPEYEP